MSKRKFFFYVGAAFMVGMMAAAIPTFVRTQVLDPSLGDVRPGLRDLELVRKAEATGSAAVASGVVGTQEIDMQVTAHSPGITAGMTTQMTTQWYGVIVIHERGPKKVTVVGYNATALIEGGQPVVTLTHPNSVPTFNY